MTEPLATFTNHFGLIQATRARRIALGYSQLEVDHRAGLPTGYTGKLEAILTRPDARNARAIGWQSLPLVLGALGLSMSVIPSAATNNAPSPCEPPLAAKGRMGGKSRALRMTETARSEAARKAVLARWGKHRPSRSKDAEHLRRRQKAWRERQRAKRALAVVMGS